VLFSWGANSTRLLKAEIIPTEPETDNAGAGKSEESILLSITISVFNY